MKMIWKFFGRGPQISARELQERRRARRAAIGTKPVGTANRLALPTVLNDASGPLQQARS